jgi:hypothetical protein
MQDITMTCTIVKSPLSSMENSEITQLVNNFTSSIVLSVLAKPDDKLKLLIDTLVYNNLSDLCIIDDEEVRIKRVYTSMKEKNIDQTRLYFLNSNRVIS